MAGTVYVDKILTDTGTTVNVSNVHFTTLGNVGLGTATPGAKLEIFTDRNEKFILNAELDSANYQNQITFENAGTPYANIVSGKNASNAAIGLTFATGSSGSLTERLRIGPTGTLTYGASTLASYQWTAWNPTNVTGTVTTAPSTGTTDDSNYVTMVNSSGTLTVTFDVAGTYLICIQMNATHSNIYTFDTFYANLGGTATRRIGVNDPQNWGESANDGNMSIATSFYVSATAAQTLTIQPQYRVSGGGTTASHAAYCSMTVQYCGG